MFSSYSETDRQTMKALARAYCDGWIELSDEDTAALIEHSQAYFAQIPLRFRLVVRAVLWVFRVSSFAISPSGGFLDKSVEAQARVYDRFCGGSSYVSALLTQVLHLTFVGSLFSLPRVLAAIMDSGERSHQRLQDEAKPHRRIRPFDQVVPESSQGFARNAVPHHTGDEKHDSERDDQLGQDAQFLRSGIAHGAAPACLTMQRNPTWLVEVSTGSG